MSPIEKTKKDVLKNARLKYSFSKTKKLPKIDTKRLEDE